MNIPRGKLLALVAIFAAVGIVTATGAFTTVSAERTAEIGVSGDSGALLGLDAQHDIASNDGGTLSISMADVNLEAVTTYATVFTVSNNGENEVAVNVTNFDYQDSDPSNQLETNGHEEAVDFVVSAADLAGDEPGSPIGTISGTGAVYSINETPIELGAGDSVTVGMYIDTTGISSLDDTGGDSSDLVDVIDISANSETVDNNDNSNDGNLEVESSSQS